MKIKYILTIGFLLIILSCSKFLQPKSQSEFVPKDANSLNEILIGSAYPTHDLVDFHLFDNMMDDDVSTTKTNSKSSTTADNYTLFKNLFAYNNNIMQIFDEDGITCNTWETGYKKILGTNAVLDYLDRVDGTVEMKAYVKAQALSLRALYYFDLVNMYGEPYGYDKKAPGVPLKLDSNMGNETMKRNSVEEVYEQILNDLNAAEILYKTISKNLQFQKNYRTSLPMIYLLKARAYLAMEKWSEAVEYAEKLVNDKTFSLLNLNSYNATNEKPYYKFTTYDYPEAIWLYGSANDVTKIITSSALFDDALSKKYILFTASDALINCFDKENDIRYKQYLVKEYASSSNFACYSKLEVSVGDLNTSVPLSFGKIMRLSEAYLILAESLYQLGVQNETRVVQLLEELRQNRYKEGTDYTIPTESRSGSALYEFIKNERRRELCFEGNRIKDLRRWGMPAFSRDWFEYGKLVRTIEVKEKDAAYILPVPEIVIERNPNILPNRVISPK